MNHFREEIVQGLGRSATLQELIEVISRHKDQGVTQKDAYETLEALWIEMGCQGAEEENMTCSQLGALMDRVWGYCSTKDAIWHTSLPPEG